MVTMEELVRYTLIHEMVPQVVAEFRNITVGGAISGASLESTSHKYGLFMDTVAWIQVRNGDGSVVTTHRGDSLWCSLSGSYGTIGIVLEAAIECVAACPFVQVSYYCFESIESTTEALMSASEQNQEDFLEGLDFPKEQVDGGTTAMMQGKMIGSFGGSEYKIGWKSEMYGGSFYYEHVRDLLIDHLRKSKNPYADLTAPFFMEIIMIEDYLFRYDNGAFWMARPMAFEWSKLWTYFPFIIGLFIASYHWVRTYTGALFTAKNLFQMLKVVPQAVIASKMVVQDLYMPPKKAIELVKWVRANIPLTTPIWLCPVRTNKDQIFTPNFHKEEKIMLNCAIYGRVPNGRGREYTKKLEEKCRKGGGRKMLYAQNHYTEKSFWEIHDKDSYDRLRCQHKAEGWFPDMYEKTCSPIPELTNSMFESTVSLFL
jgi:delta24-sterol reductase